MFVGRGASNFLAAGLAGGRVGGCPLIHAWRVCEHASYSVKNMVLEDGL